MKKTRMPQRLLSLVLVLMMLISVLPVSAMAAELTPSDPETGLTATDVTNELTDSDRLAIFEENMDSDKVSRSEIPADDEMVRVIVQLDADSLLDIRNRTNASMSMLDFQQFGLGAHGPAFAAAPGPAEGHILLPAPQKLLLPGVGPVHGENFFRHRLQSSVSSASSTRTTPPGCCPSRVC